MAFAPQYWPYILGLLTVGLIIWAVLDIITIVILVTGLYLWLRRRKSGVSIERAVAGSVGTTEQPVFTS